MAEALPVLPSRLEGMDRSVPVWALAAFILALLILLPLGWLAYVSVSGETGLTLAHYRKVFTTPRFKGANECNGDFAPDSLCYSRRAFPKVCSFEQTAIDESSENFRTSDLLDVAFCFTNSRRL